MISLQNKVSVYLNISKLQRIQKISVFTTLDIHVVGLKIVDINLV